MWRKGLIAMLLALVWLTTATAATAQEKSYSAQRFDVDVVVQDDGALRVTETVVFDFVGGPFTFVFRELETDWSDGIVDIQAAVDGRPYPAGENPGQVEISGSDPLRVEYHFEPTSSRTRTFTLSYTMLGVVRQEESADLLVYQPLPDSFEYTIDRSTTTIRYPSAARLLAPPTLDTGRATIGEGTNQVTLITEDISPNETLVVRLPFTPGSLISQPPAWQQAQATQQRWAPAWLAAAAAVLVAGFSGLALTINRLRPQPGSSGLTFDAPPDKLPVALAGALTTTGGSPNWSHALGTLFDLADRGLLVIDELPEKKWYREYDFEIRQVAQGSDLRPHEKGLLDVLFEEKSGRTTAVRMSDLQSKISGSRWKKFSEPLKDEIEAAGFLSPERQRSRTRLIVFGLIIDFFSFAALLPLVFAGGVVGLWPLAVFFALLLVGIGFIIGGGTLSPLTDEAAARAAGWQRFFDFLKDVTRGRATVLDEAFDRYLPYAAAAGLLPAWVKRFEKQGWTAVPAYFHGIGAAPGHNMAAFVAWSTAVNASGGTAAGATGAGAAGAGAAGGGASGAG